MSRFFMCNAGASISNSCQLRRQSARSQCKIYLSEASTPLRIENAPGAWLLTLAIGQDSNRHFPVALRVMRTDTSTHSARAELRDDAAVRGLRRRCDCTVISHSCFDIGHGVRVTILYQKRRTRSNLLVVSTWEPGERALHRRRKPRKGGAETSAGLWDHQGFLCAPFASFESLR